jgi:hypothetical protein
MVANCATTCLCMSPCAVRWGWQRRQFGEAGSSLAVVRWTTGREIPGSYPGCDKFITIYVYPFFLFFLNKSILIKIVFNSFWVSEKNLIVNYQIKNCKRSFILGKPRGRRSVLKSKQGPGADHLWGGSWRLAKKWGTSPSDRRLWVSLSFILSPR